MRKFLAILVLFIFFVPLKASSQTLALNDSTKIDMEPVVKVLSELGINCSGDLQSMITGFLSKFSGDITSVLKGDVPYLATPEGLMSVSALAAALMAKNPALKLALAGAGGAGLYHSVVTNVPDSITVPLQNRVPAVEENVETVTPSAKSVSSETLEKPEEQSFFNTIGGGAKNR